MSTTQYGWVVSPFPTGTFTRQDAPSLSWRDNVPFSGATLAARPLQGIVGLPAAVVSLRTRNNATDRPGPRTKRNGTI